MNFKKILVTLVFALSLLSISAYAKTMQFTMGDYDAKVDNGAVEVRTMEVAPYTVEGRTMVPVRIISEVFGADVQYIHDELKVVITLGNKNNKRLRTCAGGCYCVKVRRLCACRFKNFTKYEPCNGRSIVNGRIHPRTKRRQKYFF